MLVRGDDLVDGPVLPLLARGLLLLAGTAVIALGEPGPSAALGPALALLIVIAFGAIPLPGAAPRIIQALAETTVLGFVIGSREDIGGAFIPLVLVAVFSAGQRGGIQVGAGAGVVGGLSWSLSVLSTDLPSQVAAGLQQPLLWTGLLMATGAIGGWVRRLTLENQTYSDNAYEDAFRLLTELQEVARDLSLGLDPTTLATSLVDQVGDLVPGSVRTLSVRSGEEGRLTALVGSGGGGAPLPDGPGESAWASGRHVSHQLADGQQHDGFPVRMGDQVIAVLDVRGSALPAETVTDIECVVSDVGPKLAAALVFDDVRQLATVDERLRLAREIHDGVAQELASVGYMLDDLSSRVPDDAATELQDLRGHVRRVVGELRLSIFDLRAGVNDSIGLGTALSEHVQRIGQQSDLVVHTVLDEQGERLPAGVEVELLRIAQEAVTNVRKHAQASNLWVECTVDPPRAWVRIADDGIGLQPARPQSMGMRGMRERARRIGGDLAVSDRAGGGTVVEVSIGEWDDYEDGRS